MNSIEDEIFKKLSILNLVIVDEDLSKTIVKMAISSIENFIKCEISPFIDFSKIREAFVDVVIGEYLIFIKNSGLDIENISKDAIKSITEGDTSITYFENKKIGIDALVEYFFEKKKVFYNFKTIVW